MGFEKPAARRERSVSMRTVRSPVGSDGTAFAPSLPSVPIVHIFRCINCSTTDA